MDVHAFTRLLPKSRSKNADAIGAHAAEPLSAPGAEDRANRYLSARWSPGKIGLLAFAIALLCWFGLAVDWHRDNTLLRRQAMVITANLTTDSERIRAINDWVYGNQGFGQNHDYFIVPALGPTPLQVLEKGGDCADKSRLLAAMLNELGIEAGLVMIAPCGHCDYIHTVIEAQYEGGRMVVDPTWNIDYPAGDGKFLGVRNLAWTKRGEERVVELQRQRGEESKIAKMPAVEAKFEHAVAMNWDRDRLTRTSAAILRLLGYDPETMYRPRLLEDPKMALCWFLSILTIGLGMTSIIFSRIGKS